MSALFYTLPAKCSFIKNTCFNTSPAYSMWREFYFGIPGGPIRTLTRRLPNTGCGLPNSPPVNEWNVCNSRHHPSIQNSPSYSINEFLSFLQWKMLEMSQSPGGVLWEGNAFKFVSISYPHSPRRKDLTGPNSNLFDGIFGPGTWF